MTTYLFDSINSDYYSNDDGFVLLPSEFELLCFPWSHPEDTALPDNRKRSGQKIFDVYYPMSSWGAVLDVLRNESPVYFNYSDSSNAAQIYTDREPVGEEETTGPDLRPFAYGLPGAKRLGRGGPQRKAFGDSIPVHQLLTGFSRSLRAAPLIGCHDQSFLQ